jgi:peptide-methionine (S)-S-oxide reductase
VLQGGFAFGLAVARAGLSALRYSLILKERHKAMTQQVPAGKEVAILGGGCFWCIEAVFDDLKGVEDVESGYAGGPKLNPTYEQICNGNTGHAEVVRVVFDPAIISFKEILTVFFTIHDPTTLNRQGNDSGTQYRSVVFYLDEAQRQMAQETIAELSGQGLWDAPVVTEVSAYSNYYAAEDYHQEYFRRNPNQGYCAVVVAPKVAKFRAKYFKQLKG